MQVSNSAVACLLLYVVILQPPNMNHSSSSSSSSCSSSKSSSSNSSNSSSSNSSNSSSHLAVLVLLRRSGSHRTCLVKVGTGCFGGGWVGPKEGSQSRRVQQVYGFTCCCCCWCTLVMRHASVIDYVVCSISTRSWGGSRTCRC